MSSVQIIDDGSAKSGQLFQGWCRKCCCVFRMERRDLDQVDNYYLPISSALYGGPTNYERGQAKCPQCKHAVSLSVFEKENKKNPSKSWWAKLWEAFTA